GGDGDRSFQVVVMLLSSGDVYGGDFWRLLGNLARKDVTGEEGGEAPAGVIEGCVCGYEKS
nr:hypothetical protein [Tanacetum cinerariifolium]